QVKSIEGAADADRIALECEQFVQVATKTGAETRIVTPFTSLKSKIAVTFQVHYASAAEYLSIARRLWAAACRGFSRSEEVVQQILEEVTVDVQFDVSRLGHRETALLPNHLWVRRVEPLLEVRGLLQLSNEAIYFQPHPNFSSKPVKQVPLSDVLHVFRRVYGIQANALEIITVSGDCLYLCFDAHGQCDQVARLLVEQRRSEPGPSLSPAALFGLAASVGGNAEGVLQDVRKMTALWQSGLLSNFHYLDFLNCAAGRSTNDFSQYPVFPWVLSDYTSETLDLDDLSVYRDLTKPVGALSEKRLAYFQERLAGMPEGEDRFLYGTHYSTPAYVIYWLLRAMPERMLRLHSGHFDAWARLFRSVAESWDSVNESTASLMELVPEFFVLPGDWLENSLGIVTAEGPLVDVQLPRWASSASDFICKMRAALESEHVSRHLPAWIDLIFGFKQSGEAAVKANNLFHPVCYTGSTGTPEAAVAASGLPMSVLELQLKEFGRMPQQLFSEAHPPRLRVPRWEAGQLRDDPKQSEPWYKAVRHISAHSTADSPEVLPTSSRTSGTPTPAVAGAAGSSASTGSALPRFSAGAGGSGGYASNGSTSAPAPTVSTASGRGAASRGWTGAGTVAGLRALRPRPLAPFETSGSVTGIASCSANLYSIGEDGCLRVSVLPGSIDMDGSPSLTASASMRRNFRISPMPLSALAVLQNELLAVGGHDNTVSLYSTSCGSSLAKCQVHADTVTCLSVSPDFSTLVSGSRDQSVITWSFTPSSLKQEVTFDDLQQPITCVAASGDLVLSGSCCRCCC
ncbi:unnamed protein product, partial [Polarella glacialis]